MSVENEDTIRARYVCNICGAGFLTSQSYLGHRQSCAEVADTLVLGSGPLKEIPLVNGQSVGVDPKIDICTCGHSRLVHQRLGGHGECDYAASCGCQRFTWDHFDTGVLRDPSSGKAVLRRDTSVNVTTGERKQPVARKPRKPRARKSPTLRQQQIVASIDRYAKLLLGLFPKNLEGHFSADEVDDIRETLYDLRRRLDELKETL